MPALFSSSSHRSAVTQRCRTLPLRVMSVTRGSYIEPSAANAFPARSISALIARSIWSSLRHFAIALSPLSCAAPESWLASRRSPMEAPLDLNGESKAILAKTGLFGVIRSRRGTQ